LALGFLSLYFILINRDRWLMAIVLMVCWYTVFNTFIAKCTPNKVVINKNYLAFYIDEKETRYPLKSIKYLKIREFPSALKMYIRINDYGLMNGRYWIQGRRFDEGKELFHQLLDIEYSLFPNTLKAQARRTNTEFLEKKKNQPVVKNQSLLKRIFGKGGKKSDV